MKNAGIYSALVGLMGAVNNNGKTEDTDSIVLEALMSEDSDAMIEKIRAEKYRISPSCATCASPCGNTSDYDMQRFYEGTVEEIQVKTELIEMLENYAGELKVAGVSALPEVVYKAISYIGYGLAADSYRSVMEEIRRG